MYKITKLESFKVIPVIPADNRVSEDEVPKKQETKVTNFSRPGTFRNTLFYKSGRIG